MLRGVPLPLSFLPSDFNAAERSSGSSSFDFPQRSISSVSVLSLPDTHTSCSSPPPSPPAFVASYTHLLLLLTARVPNEALWECSLASSLKIDLFTLCCFGEAAGTDRLPRAPYGLATPAFLQQRRRQKCTQKGKPSCTYVFKFVKLVCAFAHTSFGRNEHMWAQSYP